MFMNATPEDLMHFLQLQKMRAEYKSREENNSSKLKRTWNQGRRSAFDEVLGLLKDYFAAQPAELVEIPKAANTKGAERKFLEASGELSIGPNGGLTTEFAQDILNGKWRNENTPDFSKSGLPRERMRQIEEHAKEPLKDSIHPESI